MSDPTLVKSIQNAKDPVVMARVVVCEVTDKKTKQV